MEPLSLIAALEQLARRLGIEVRSEALPPGGSPERATGGLCRIRGRWVIFVDQSAPPTDRAGTLARALGGFDLDDFYLPPAVRQTIVTGGRPPLPWKQRPLARTRPRR